MPVVGSISGIFFPNNQPGWFNTSVHSTHFLPLLHKCMSVHFKQYLYVEIHSWEHTILRHKEHTINFDWLFSWTVSLNMVKEHSLTQYLPAQHTIKDRGSITGYIGLILLFKSSSCLLVKKWFWKLSSSSLSSRASFSSSSRWYISVPCLLWKSQMFLPFSKVFDLRKE